MDFVPETGDLSSEPPFSITRLLGQELAGGMHPLPIAHLRTPAILFLRTSSKKISCFAHAGGCRWGTGDA